MAVISLIRSLLGVFAVFPSYSDHSNFGEITSYCGCDLTFPGINDVKHIFHNLVYFKKFFFPKVSV